MRRHALAQSCDAVFKDGLFRMIHAMMELALVANKKGLLALDEGVQSIPSDICFYSDIQSAVCNVCEGTDAEDLIEILTSRYWTKNLQGGNALVYYFVVLSVVRIQDGILTYQLEQLLTACLSEENRVAYEECRKQQKNKEHEPDELERLLNYEPDIGNGGILIVKRFLEEKIECADATDLKRTVRNAAESDLVISLKGLSISARKKLLSAIPEHRAKEYARDCERMGPVRKIDVMAAMAELITFFEDQPVRRAEKK